MKSELEGMKAIEIVEPVITIRSAMKPENETQMKELIAALVK